MQNPHPAIEKPDLSKGHFLGDSKRGTTPDYATKSCSDVGPYDLTHTLKYQPRTYSIYWYWYWSILFARILEETPRKPMAASRGTLKQPHSLRSLKAVSMEEDSAEVIMASQKKETQPSLDLLSDLFFLFIYLFNHIWSTLKCTNQKDAEPSQPSLDRLFEIWAKSS